MWRALEMWMKVKGLGDCCRQLLKEVATIKSMDVVLPVKNGTELRLRVVARPDTCAGTNQSFGFGTTNCSKNDSECSLEKQRVNYTKF